ncbi:MAG: sugar phosphate isomerase/epimerase [Verrucomicrobiota bacterium]
MSEFLPSPFRSHLRDASQPLSPSIPCSRRNFLTLSSLLLSGAHLQAQQPTTATSAASWPKQSVQHGFVLSVQSYTLRDFNIFEAIERVGQTGASAIEIWDGHPVEDKIKVSGMNAEQTNQLLKTLSRNNIRVSGMYAGIPKDEAGAERIFNRAKELGVYSLITESVDAIDVTEKMAATYDIRVGYHGHPKSTKSEYKLWNPEYLLDLLKDRDPRLGVCLDIGHQASSGLVPLESLRILKNRVHGLHIKDRAVIGRASEDIACGTGILDIAGILKELKSMDFRGCLTVEFEAHLGNNLTDIAQYIGFMRGVGATLELK